MPKMSETKDQVKRSRRVFYHLIQPLGAMTHAIRDDALIFALDLYNSAGVNKLLTAAFAEMHPAVLTCTPTPFFLTEY